MRFHETFVEKIYISLPQSKFITALLRNMSPNFTVLLCCDARATPEIIICFHSAALISKKNTEPTMWKILYEPLCYLKNKLDSIIIIIINSEYEKKLLK